MNSTVARLILQERKIAYAVTDRDLNVVEVGGAIDVLGGGSGNKTYLGHPLPKLVPELIGCEEVLGAILAGELGRFELNWVNRETAEGRTIYLTMVDLPYRDRTGQITGLFHLMGDVTEMGTMYQQLVQSRNWLRLLQDQLARQNLELAAANAELRRLDEIKSTFISVAAHELRSPLTTICGYVEMLLGGEFGTLTDNQRQSLEIVQRSASRLLTIASNLLDVTRIESGRLELVLRPTDLAALVKTVTDEFRPQLEAKAQRLILRIASDLPPALCDETRAAQIVGNLLSNANKYTPHGGVITVSLTPSEEEGFLLLSVADNGIGISAEDQARLFDRFFRAQNAVLAGAGGAGLGLYIVRSLIELHGGRIWLESKLDEGTTFYVTFPIADGLPAASKDATATTSA